MKISQSILNIRESLAQVLLALANRLTVENNFGPQGKVGQILVSNGDRDTDPPPSFQTLIPLEVLRGGTAGQVLTKNSDKNYDYSWQ